MQITLLRTGGIIPMTKKAEKDVSWSEQEAQELMKTIGIENYKPGESRDATGYQLTLNNETIAIDWEKIPLKYQKTFEELKDSLKPVRM